MGYRLRPEGLWPVELDTGPDLREEFSQNPKHLLSCDWWTPHTGQNITHHMTTQTLKTKNQKTNTSFSQSRTIF